MIKHDGESTTLPITSHKDDHLQSLKQSSDELSKPKKHKKGAAYRTYIYWYAPRSRIVQPYGKLGRSTLHTD